MSLDRPAGADPCGGVDLEPKRPDNRPGLEEIAYRIGTHSAFLRRMKWRIPRQEVVDSSRLPASGGTERRPLAGLTARDPQDPTIALLDAWAATLDVLSFYSERLAHEGYLRTATERRSMVELARTIGYELAPGVAASAQLAFTVEDADDPFRAVEVAAGTQAMSVPQEKGQLPQVFETVEPILARAEWNAMPARTEQPQHLALYWNPAEEGDERNGRLYLIDLDNSFDSDQLEPGAIEDLAAAGDLAPYYPLSADLDLEQALADLQEDAGFNLAIDPRLHAVEINETFLRGTGLGLAAGDRVLAVGARAGSGGKQQVATAALRIVEAEADPEFAVTRVVLAPLGAAAPPRRLSFPVIRSARLRIGAVTTATVAFNATSVDRVVRRTAWSGDTFGAFLSTQRWPRRQLMRLVRQPPERVPPELGEVRPGFFALRQSVGFFGNSAPRQETLAKADETKGGTAGDPYAKSWDKPPGRRSPVTIWSDSQGVALPDADVYLEREVDELAVDQWALLQSPAGDALALRVAAVSGGSRADFAINGKATGLTFRRADGSDLEVTLGTLTSDLVPFRFRTARAHLVSEPLETAGAPIKEDLVAGAPELALDSLYLDLERGRPLSIAGERADAPGVVESETLIIDDVLHLGGVTRIVFAGGPTYEYRRSTLRVNANVALSTHGERYEEQVGSGDAATANQAFELSKTPLTFVSAATESGTATSLTVRVEGVTWAESPSLLEAGPEDEVYQARIDDDGATRIVFGDGIHGRRLPTGQLNVTTSYRSGIGAAGEMPDEAIIQLKTRPLGIRSVVNPSPATGSAEPETLATARDRAPQSVRTLGRIVSLTDYADFARAFAGIGKAMAVSLWLGHERIAHLSVAPEAEGVFDESAATLSNLRNAVDGLRNATHRVVVAPHVQSFFRLSARLTYSRRHLPEDVEAAARQALTERFGFAARDLAQPVSAAEVIAALQGVSGVVAVDLDTLALYDQSVAEETSQPANVLFAPVARVAQDAGEPAILPAALLTVLVSGIELTLEADDG